MVLRFSLRTNLLLLLGLIAVLLAADQAREIVNARSAAIADARAQILAIAHDHAHHQADLIAETRAILGLVVSLAQTDGRSITGCQVPFRRIQANRPWIMSMTLVHAKGHPLCTSAQQLLTANVADRPYFKKVLETRGFVLSDYLVSRLTDKPAILAAMPRVLHGKVQNVVVASLDPAWLGRLATQSLNSAAEILVIDEAGTVVAAHPEPEKWVGKSLTARESFWNAFTSEEGVFQSAALDGTERLVGRMKVQGTGATVVVLGDPRFAVAQANRLAKRALLQSLVVGLLGVAFVWFGGELLVVRPITELTDRVAQFGKGEWSTRVDPSHLPLELRALGATFNQMAARLSANEADLRRANEQLVELAFTDGLTGIANRRRFDDWVAAEWQRAGRTAQPVAVLMADVDDFKKFNDRYGHLEGDMRLKQIAILLAHAARRPGDLAARTGGEEFAVILPGAWPEDAAAVAEAIREAIIALGVEHRDSTAAGVLTVSIGVAALVPSPGQSASDLIHAADAALYRAKRAGRNRVTIHRSPMALAS